MSIPASNAGRLVAFSIVVPIFARRGCCPGRDAERLAQLASGEEGPLIERTCAENPNSFFPGEDVLAIPQAAKADF